MSRCAQGGLEEVVGVMAVLLAELLRKLRIGIHPRLTCLGQIAGANYPLECSLSVAVDLAGTALVIQLEDLVHSPRRQQ